MIRYHIPAEHADAVRAALWKCEECGNNTVGQCRRCGNRTVVPSSFWWGVTVKWCSAHLAPIDPGDSGCWDSEGPGCTPTLPFVVQQMLDPCENPLHEHYSKTPGDFCPDCRDGRPLVELVTDCDEPDIRRFEDLGWHNGPTCEMTGCKDDTVSLGVVTADKVVHSPSMCLTDWLGPSDSTHAIHLTRAEQ